MTSPAFVSEMTAQLEAARQEVETSTDADTAALAAARLADLTDLTRRHGTGITHILIGDGGLNGPALAGS